MSLPKRRKIDGRKLKAAREARGWSLRQAAIHLGTSAQVLHCYERRGIQPREETLARILPILGVTYEELWHDWRRKSA